MSVSTKISKTYTQVLTLAKNEKATATYASLLAILDSATDILAVREYYLNGDDAWGSTLLFFLFLSSGFQLLIWYRTKIINQTWKFKYYFLFPIFLLGAGPGVEALESYESSGQSDANYALHRGLKLFEIFFESFPGGFIQLLSICDPTVKLTPLLLISSILSLISGSVGITSFIRYTDVSLNINYSNSYYLALGGAVLFDWMFRSLSIGLFRLATAGGWFGFVYYMIFALICFGYFSCGLCCYKCCIGLWKNDKCCNVCYKMDNKEALIDEKVYEITSQFLRKTQVPTTSKNLDLEIANYNNINTNNTLDLDTNKNNVIPPKDISLNNLNPNQNINNTVINTDLQNNNANSTNNTNSITPSVNINNSPPSTDTKQNIQIDESLANNIKQFNSIFYSKHNCCCSCLLETSKWIIFTIVYLGSGVISIWGIHEGSYFVIFSNLEIAGRYIINIFFILIFTDNYNNCGSYCDNVKGKLHILTALNNACGLAAILCFILRSCLKKRLLLPVDKDMTKSDKMEERVDSITDAPDYMQTVVDIGRKVL